MSTLTLSVEKLKQAEAALPVATYTCQDCAMEEHTDPFWDPFDERWVCEGCYDHAAEEHGFTGDPIRASDLPGLLAEPTTPAPRFAVVAIDHTGQAERCVLSPRPAITVKDICELYGWDDLHIDRDEGDSLRIELEPDAPGEPDYGSPADGPVWTVVGLYDNGQVGVFSIHAQDSQGALKTQIEAAKEADVIGDSFDALSAFPGALTDALA